LLGSKKRGGKTLSLNRVNKSRRRTDANVYPPVKGGTSRQSTRNFVPMSDGKIRP